MTDTNVRATSSASHQAIASGATSASVTLPSALTVGDPLEVFVASDNAITVGVVGSISGWTLDVAQTAMGTGSFFVLKRTGGWQTADGTTLTVPLTGVSATTHWTYVGVGLKGSLVDWGTHGTVTVKGSNTNTTTATGSGSPGQDIVTVFFGKATNQNGTPTVAPDATVIVSVQPIGTSNENTWVGSYTPGTVQTQTITYSVNTSNGAGYQVPLTATTTPVTLSETGSGADALTVSPAVPLAETGHGTDAVALSASLAVAETAAATDTLAVSMPVALVGDSGQGGDSLDSVTAAVPLSEVTAGADAFTVSAAVTLADTAAATDALTVAAAATLTETAAGGDTLPAVPATVHLADTGAAGDSLNVAQGSNPVLSDTAAGSDAVTLTAAVALAQTAAGADALAVSPAVPVADTASAGDTLAAAVVVHLTETGAGADALSVVQGRNPDLPDTAAAVDALTTAAAIPLADVAAASETSFAIAATATAAELAAAADTLALAALLTLDSEQASAVDQLTIARHQVVDLVAHATVARQTPDHTAAIATQSSRYRAATVSRTTYTAHLEPQ